MDHGSTGQLGHIVTDAIARFGDRDLLYDGTTRWTYCDLGDAIAFDQYQAAERRRSGPVENLRVLQNGPSHSPLPQPLGLPFARWLPSYFRSNNQS